ncbi:hypothetical protein AXK11_07225 [Cephaloticoccus primus]|uniref:Glycosyltransferase 2-like domain-containing protein n=1 Tax=Cephaloticoccus primus TaxID=1548207 RepID=A0A139SKR3_9BACT|nr:glycosyltransferase [Cephaloticoccus primus]KXU35136.1 hypothetical protein AXK11_07225 [Cephaloticoccus primus]
MSTEALPLITVAVCTYNRAVVLRQMLERLVAQHYPTDRLELLVVDNNSTDGGATRAVVESFSIPAAPPASSASPSRPTTHTAAPIRYLHEPGQGLCRARNRAIAEARGDIIALPDDDILMEPDWLRELCAPLIAQWREGPEGRKTIGCVAGEVVPIFPDGQPEWIAEWHGPQGFRSAAEGAGPLPPQHSPMGANFAFPRWVFEQVGSFRTELDRKGASFFGGGDREMVSRIREAGCEVWFVPAASVLHQMPASRTTFRYAARHAFDSARSRVVERVKRSESGAKAGAAYLVSRFLANVVKALGFALLAAFWALLLQHGAAKKALVRAWRSCGYLYQIPRSLFGRV